MTATASEKTNTPLVEELAEALSPQDAFERLAGLPYILFLDSAAENDTQGRYSYITARPFEVLKTTGDSTELLAAEGELDSPSYKITGVEKPIPSRFYVGGWKAGRLLLCRTCPLSREARPGSWDTGWPTPSRRSAVPGMTNSLCPTW